MPKKQLVNLNTGELQEEINARADYRVGEILSEIVYFRHPMNRTRTPTDLGDEPSMTHQSHADSCDVNRIVAQFDRTGYLPPPKQQPYYDDVSHLNQPLADLTTQSMAAAAQYDQDLKRLAEKKSTPTGETQNQPSPTSPATSQAPVPQTQATPPATPS